MPEDRDELLGYYRGTRASLLTAIKGLTDAQMTETSIDGWSVKDHLAHIAFWDDLRWQEVVRISAGHESAWRMTGEQDDIVNGLSYEFRKALPLAQARWEFEESRRRLIEAITSATARGLDASLYGEAGLRTGHEAEHTEWLRRWRGERGY